VYEKFFISGFSNSNSGSSEILETEIFVAFDGLLLRMLGMLELMAFSDFIKFSKLAEGLVRLIPLILLLLEFPSIFPLLLTVAVARNVSCPPVVCYGNSNGKEDNYPDCRRDSVLIFVMSLF